MIQLPRRIQRVFSIEHENDDTIGLLGVTAGLEVLMTVGNQDSTECEASLESDAVLPRHGDIEACPVCGLKVHSESYHCPACRNYYCFHCRARLIPGDVQVQCVNQQCAYYGKLVCGECDLMTEKEAAPLVYMEPEDGYWPAWLAIVVCVLPLVWYFSSFLIAIGISVSLYVVGGWLLHRAGLNLFGRVRQVKRNRTLKQHDCIRCHQPAKQIMGSR